MDNKVKRGADQGKKKKNKKAAEEPVLGAVLQKSLDLNQARIGAYESGATPEYNVAKVVAVHGNNRYDVRILGSPTVDRYELDDKFVMRKAPPKGSALSVDTDRYVLIHPVKEVIYAVFPWDYHPVDLLSHRGDDFAFAFANRRSSSTSVARSLSSDPRRRRRSTPSSMSAYYGHHNRSNSHRHSHRNSHRHQQAPILRSSSRSSVRSSPVLSSSSQKNHSPTAEAEAEERAKAKKLRRKTARAAKKAAAPSQKPWFGFF